MCARFLGVKPASAMEVNAWICTLATARDLSPRHDKVNAWIFALATDRDLEDIVSSFRLYFSGIIFRICNYYWFPVLFLRHYFRICNDYQFPVLFLRAPILI